MSSNYKKIFELSFKVFLDYHIKILPSYFKLRSWPLWPGPSWVREEPAQVVREDGGREERVRAVAAGEEAGKVRRTAT